LKVVEKRRKRVKRSRKAKQEEKQQLSTGDDSRRVSHNLSQVSLKMK